MTEDPIAKAFASEITDEGLNVLARNFLERTLPASAWTHRAHLLTGLMLARRLEPPALMASLRENIRAYNLATGGRNTAEAGYHETVTAFYVQVLGAFARATRDLGPSDAAGRLLASRLAERDILLRAYDDATLKSSAARLAYQPPDRTGFDPERLVAEALAEPAFVVRLATRADIEQIGPLMRDAIGVLLKPFLAPDQIEASREIMGLDTQLIVDGAYYVVLNEGEIVGCGGWSRRATLFGGDHSAGRDAALLDPAREPARVRAMYTKPGWERRGIGRRVLATCEAAAAGAHFTACELASTLGGEPLYRACGYVPIEAFEAPTSTGLGIPLIRMRKRL